MAAGPEFNDVNKEILIREIEKVYRHKYTIARLVSLYDKVIVLGNGGSNAIASHIAQDYTKMLGKKTLSFSDASRLTCYINDYGMENANTQFLKEFADKDTLAILISSSGNSENMVRALKYCVEKAIPHVVLTGFNEKNKMRELASCCDLNVWVDSTDYGVVELTHEILLHSIIGD